MNDFLHSLRTGKDKRYDRTRRGPDNGPYRPNDRQNSIDKRKRGNYSKSNVAENAYVTIAKLLPPVKSLLETIVTNEKDLLKFEERKTSGEDCPGYCLHETELRSCPAHCECAYIREIIQRIKTWVKN